MSEENTLKQNEAEHGLDLVTKIAWKQMIIDIEMKLLSFYLTHKPELRIDHLNALFWPRIEFIDLF